MKLPVHEIVRRRDALSTVGLGPSRRASHADEPHEFADEVFADRDVHTARVLRMDTSRPVGLCEAVWSSPISVEFSDQPGEPLFAYSCRVTAAGSCRYTSRGC